MPAIFFEFDFLRTILDSSKRAELFWRKMIRLIMMRRELTVNQLHS